MEVLVKNHIRQLNVAEGGGIVSENLRAETIPHPMLVIGIGGTGIDALLRLKYQVNRRFILPEDEASKRKLSIPNNIKFLGLETNEDDSKKDYYGVKLDTKQEFLEITNPGVGELLKNRSSIPPHISNWISPELHIDQGTKGANGNRQAGRLLFFTNLREITETISKKIEDLVTGNTKLLYVFILSGLSGGTGGGTFIDLPYIIRGIMVRDYQTDIDRVKILGYLFTPDVNISKEGVSDHAKEYIKKNGYASLKELDYWMNIADRGEKFEQTYGRQLEVKSHVAPFDMCHLISATDMNKQLLPKAYDYCMNVVAENITNFMTNEEKQTGQDFAILDYLSNIESLIDNMNKEYSANYKYTVIGSSMAMLPIENVATYLAFRIFEKFNPIFDQKPSEESVKGLMKDIYMDIESVEKRFKESENPDPFMDFQTNPEYSSYNVIEEKTVNMDDYLKTSYLEDVETQYINIENQLPGELYNKFETKMREIFKNPSFGPIYVSQIISSNRKDGFDIVNTIDSYVESLQKKIKTEERIELDRKRKAGIKFAEAEASLLPGVLPRRRNIRKNSFIQLKRKEYESKANILRYNKMIEVFKDLRERLNNLNKRSYFIFSEILEELKTIFDKNGDRLWADKQDDKSYYWNILSIKELKKPIDDILANKDSKVLIENFCEKLLEDSEKWLNEDELDIVSTISEFVTTKFSSFIHKTIEEFLRIKYGENRSIEDITEKEIAPKLNDKSSPVFNITDPSGILKFPTFSLVSVPRNAPRITKGIEEFNRNSTGRSGVLNIHQSKMLNRIFWLNTMNGVPLYAYSPLKSYEKEYEKEINNTGGIGRHLVQTKDNDWIDLPSPIPKDSWGEYNNDRVKKKIEYSKKLFEEALKLDVIVKKEKGFYCIFTKPFIFDEEREKNFAGVGVNKPKFSEIQEYIRELEGHLFNKLPIVEEKKIFTNIQSTQEIKIRENTEENFYRSPALVKAVEAEVEKYAQIQKKIEDLKKILTTYENESKLIDNFVKILITDTIKKEGTKYIYDADSDEDEIIFVNLIETTDNVEYFVHKKFMESASKKELILQKAEKRFKGFEKSKDIKDLIKKLEDLLTTFEKRKGELDFGREKILDGVEIYEFYKEIISKVKKILNNLK